VVLGTTVKAKEERDGDDGEGGGGAGRLRSGREDGGDGVEEGDIEEGMGNFGSLTTSKSKSSS
jgi:hypothetical protein